MQEDLRHVRPQSLGCAAGAGEPWTQPPTKPRPQSLGEDHQAASATAGTSRVLLHRSSL